MWTAKETSYAGGECNGCEPRLGLVFLISCGLVDRTDLQLPIFSSPTPRLSNGVNFWTLVFAVQLCTTCTWQTYPVPSVPTTPSIMNWRIVCSYTGKCSIAKQPALVVAYRAG